jgi:hypothetical protein
MIGFAVMCVLLDNTVWPLAATELTVALEQIAPGINARHAILLTMSPPYYFGSHINDFASMLFPKAPS